MKRRIAVVTLGEPGIGWCSSGAEVIADVVCEGLSRWFEVVAVFGFGTSARIQESSQVRTSAYRAIPGFRFDASVIGTGIVRTEQLTCPAREALEEADVVLQFERVIERFFRGASIAVLGSVAYKNCYSVAASQHWDIIVAPSPFVRTFVCDRWAINESKVRVVMNGIDLNLFRPFGRQVRPRRGGALRLLLPGRPEWGKGYVEAVRFAESLVRDGFAAELHCFKYRGFLEVGGFYEELRAQSTMSRLQLHSWQSRGAMPAQYRSSTATLCLGETPEGFGLTAVESLACGVPVLYRPVGHLASLMPAESGYCTLEEFYDRWAASGNPLDVFRALAEECHDKGIGYIEENYSQEDMIYGYRWLVKSLC